jgi:hypothetical protein
MSNESVFDKVKDFIKGHPEQADQGLDKASEILNERTGGQYAEHVERGESMVREQSGIPDNEATVPAPEPQPSPEPAPAPGDPPAVPGDPTPTPGTTPEPPTVPPPTEPTTPPPVPSPDPVPTSPPETVPESSPETTGTDPGSRA